MTTVFDQAFVAAAESFFLLPGAEWIIYRPAGGTARRIRAVVTRQLAEPLDGFSTGSRPQLEILVKNNDSGGISSETVDTGGDEVDIAPVVDTKPARMRIVEVLKQNAGLMLLRIN